MNATFPLKFTRARASLAALACFCLFACGADGSEDNGSSTGGDDTSGSTTADATTGTAAQSTGDPESTSSSSSSTTTTTASDAGSSSGGAAEYQDALDFVVARIDDSHRATLEGRSPALQAAVDQANADVSGVSADFEFQQLVGRLLVALEDGHSRVGPTAAAAETLASIDLPLRWLEGGPIVVATTDLLEVGDAVLSIGGVETDDVLADLAEHVSRDNDGYLRHAGPQLVPRADWLEPRGLIDRGAVTVEVERGGASMTLALPLQAGLHVDPAPEREVVGYTIEAENDLGVFHLDDCIYDATYQTTLDAFMAEVQAEGLDKIAIDLRYNGGGDVTVAYALLNHLADDYLSFSVSARKSDALFDQALLYSNEDFLGLLTAFGVELEGPTFEVPGAALSVGLGAAVPAVEPENRFAGEVYLLVSPTTYSSAQLFVGQVVDNDLGLTVGDQTGANRNSTGDMLRFDVPNTDVAFTLGGSFQSRPAPGARQGTTLADIQVSWTRDDILEGRDPHLEAVRAL